MLDPPPAARRSPPRLVGNQVLALAIPVMVFVGIAVPLEWESPGHLRTFWTEPAATAMAAAAVVWLAVGLVAYLGGCVLMNRFTGEPRRNAVTASVGLACFVTFCVPAIYVLKVAPAAAIQKRLADG